MQLRAAAQSPVLQSLLLPPLKEQPTWMAAGQSVELQLFFTVKAAALEPVAYHKHSLLCWSGLLQVDHLVR